MRPTNPPPKSDPSVDPPPQAAARNDSDLPDVLPDDLQISNEITRDPMEVVASEFMDELRDGRRPDVSQFVLRYPDLSEEIRELFPMLLAIEDMKARQELHAVRQPLPDQLDIKQLGEFKVLREIGRGGMGIVFEGIQEKVGRHVAIKLLPWRFPSRSRWRKQFVREAQLAARLKHPHIVTVYAYGEEDGRCYYVMPLIQGVGLDRLIQRLRQGRGIVAVDEILHEFQQHGKGTSELSPGGGLSNRVLKRGAWHQFAKIAAQVATAMRYAHRQGTLHRDIKPANIMLDTKGALWITDFGLAMAKEHAVSAHEALAGTLRYMAPEQFDGSFDERSDIYSFGVTLYELCTLTPTFAATTRDTLIQQIRSGERRRPRAHVASLPRPLEAIILKCIAIDPADRYQTADEVRTDLTHYLGGRPLVGQSKSLWSKFWPWSNG
ncbi:MAG: serine/threonine protein kinase [Planctomycetaceae bacterium]|nr:serine/threonine protein kinase [Planctomycetaceae bacterium]